MQILCNRSRTHFIAQCFYGSFNDRYAIAVTAVIVIVTYHNHNSLKSVYLWRSIIPSDFRFHFCATPDPISGDVTRRREAKNVSRTTPSYIRCAHGGVVAVTDKRKGRWGFISVLKLLELCTHTRIIIIIIIIIRTVRKRDLFLRILMAPACLPRTTHVHNMLYTTRIPFP